MAKRKKVLKKTRHTSDISSVITALKNVKDNEYVKNVDLFENDFQRIIDRLLDDSFRLAVVGEFSSGKSTFLNALIGRDLLKHGAKETTATITEIYNHNNENEETYLDVYLANGDVISKVPADSITEYTATASKTHAVAQEIDKVVVNSNILGSDARVCFVDTPGLNGIADNHREKTIEQIKNAHACIYLMQVRGLGQSDIEFLKYISKYQHNIIFVQNFIDELKRLEGETPEQKVEEQRKIIEDKIVSDNKDLHYEIVAVSSRKALIAKEYGFKTYDGEELTDDLRDKLYDESRFDDVFTIINGLMEHNEKEGIQQKDTVSVALNLLEQLRKLVSFENEREAALWENSIAGKNFSNYTRLIDLLNSNKESYVQKLLNYLEAETSEIRKENKKELDDGLREIENGVKKVFAEIKDISEFESYVKNQLTGYLYQGITSMDEAVIKHMNTKFENMVDSAVLRIKQYTGAAISPAVLDKFEVAVIESNVNSFTEEEDEISKLQKELSEKRKLDEKAGKDIQEKKTKILKINSEIELQRLTITREHSNKNAEISRLGSMPEKETKYRRETYYENRGGFGILDALFGPKKKTELVPYSDNTKQQKWKKQKSDIETKYREKEDQLNAQIRMLEFKKKQCDDEIKHLEKTEAARKKDIKSRQSLLETKIDYLNSQREKAKQEYLQKAKKGILENIQEYLDGYISGMLYDNYQRAIEENSKRATQVVMSLFKVSFDSRIGALNQKLEQLNGTKTLDDASYLLSIINNTTIKLEEFLCP